MFYKCEESEIIQIRSKLTNRARGINTISLKQQNTKKSDNSELNLDREILLIRSFFGGRGWTLLTFEDG